MLARVSNSQDLFRPLPQSDYPQATMARSKNVHAVALARLGASKGGKARAKALTAEERREIARKAALARWRPAR
jgi:hypothetical protein